MNLYLPVINFSKIIFFLNTGEYNLFEQIKFNKFFDLNIKLKILGKCKLRNLIIFQHFATRKIGLNKKIHDFDLSI